MNTLIYLILLVVLFVTQTTVLPQFAQESVDLLLALALACGMLLPVTDARLAAWCAGFARDLETLGPVGLHALALGLAGLAMTALRELINLHIWWARGLLALLVGFPAQLLVRFHQRFLQDQNMTFTSMVGGAFMTALIAATLATLVAGVPGVLHNRRRRSLARF